MVDTLHSFSWNDGDLKDRGDTCARKKRAESREGGKRKQGNILTDNGRGAWLNGSIKGDLWFESGYWKSIICGTYDIGAMFWKG